VCEEGVLGVLEVREAGVLEGVAGILARGLPPPLF